MSKPLLLESKLEMAVLVVILFGFYFFARGDSLLAGYLNLVWVETLASIWARSKLGVSLLAVEDAGFFSLSRLDILCCLPLLVSLDGDWSM